MALIKQQKSPLGSFSGKVSCWPQLAGSWEYPIADDSVHHIKDQAEAAGNREVGRKDRTQLNTCCGSA